MGSFASVPSQEEKDKLEESFRMLKLGCVYFCRDTQGKEFLVIDVFAETNKKYLSGKKLIADENHHLLLTPAKTNISWSNIASFEKLGQLNVPKNLSSELWSARLDLEAYDFCDDNHPENFYKRMAEYLFRCYR